MCGCACGDEKGEGHRTGIQQGDGCWKEAIPEPGGLSPEALQ